MGECADGQTALVAIQAERPTLPFLDPELPDIAEFRVLQAVSAERAPRAVIFVTDFDQSAVRAFETHGVDYWLKPFDRHRFQQAVDRAALKLETGLVQQIHATVESNR